MVAFADLGAFALLVGQLERRLEVIHVEPHRLIEPGQHRGGLEAGLATRGRAVARLRGNIGGYIGDLCRMAVWASPT